MHKAHNVRMKKDLKLSQQKISDLYKEYSLKDILRSLYIIGAYPLNVSSPIRNNFQYEGLRGLKEEDFSQEDKILSYEDFKQFSDALIKITPEFPMLEDYSPPVDWGDTKYYFESELEYVIWGVDGSTSDQLSEFDIIYADNDEAYKTRTGRSPKEELAELLKFHSSHKININTGLKDYPDYLEPGNLEIPTREFYEDMKALLYESFEYTYPNLTQSHSINIKDVLSVQFSEKEFIKLLQDGSPIKQVFIKVGENHYPVLLRYSVENLLKSWQSEFPKYHNSEGFFKSPTNAHKHLSHRIAMYVKSRFSRHTELLPVVLDDDGQPIKDMLVSLSFSENRILGILSPKPVSTSKELEHELSKLIHPAMKALLKFKTENPKFYSPIKSAIIEMQPKESNIEYDVRLVVVLPMQTGSAFKAKLPKMPGVEYIILEDFLGILDEVEGEEDFLKFIDYMHSDNLMFTDTLDAFASFKDSSGTLIPGADVVNIALVSPTWGTSHRHKYLKEFWEMFPSVDIHDDPRNWRVQKETDTRYRLVNKSYFGVMLYSKYDHTHLTQSSPFNLQDYETGAITNLLMESLEDTFSRIKEDLLKMPIFKYGYRTQINYFPSILLKNPDFKHLLGLDPGDDIWSMDSGRFSQTENGVRVVFDLDKVIKRIRDNKDNGLELQLAKDILVQLNKIQPDEESLKKVLAKIDTLKGKPRFTQIAVDKEASHPQHSNSVKPTEIENKKARKVTAEAVRLIKQKPGRYSGDEAHTTTNEIIKELRGKIESKIAEFSYDKSILELVGIVDAEIAKYNYKKLMVLASREHDVDYQRDENLSEAKKDFLIQHRNNRYLLEKFISLKPNGPKVLGESDIRQLMAYADEIIGAYNISDALHYDIYQPVLEIENDYQLGVEYPKGITAQQEEFNKKQSRLSLGEIGNSDDRIDPEEFHNFSQELDVSFFKDFGFKFTTMMAVQQILSLWAEYTDDEEEQSYEKTRIEIIDVLAKGIKGTSKKELNKVIDFLMLEPEKILFITDDKNTPFDVPVWEHIKRPFRYSIRPLVYHNEKIVWGAYSLHMSLGLWSNVLTNVELPMKLEAPTTNVLIEREHQKRDKLLESKSIEISLRHSPYVKNVWPKHAGFPKELGDYDAVVYLKDKNILLSIEAKNINTPTVTKDARRQIETVFLRDKNYVKKVEDRADYLENNYKDFESVLGVKIADNPKVVSVFITRDIQFWTENPPRITNVNFLRIDLLDEFIESLS